MPRTTQPSGWVLKTVAGAGVAVAGLAGVAWLLWIVDRVRRGWGVVPYRSAWGVDRFPIADLVFVVLAVVALVVAGLGGWLYERWPERGGHRPGRRRDQKSARAKPVDASDTEEFERGPWAKWVAVTVFIVVTVVAAFHVLVLVVEVVQGRGFLPFRDSGGMGLPAEKLGVLALAAAAVIACWLGGWAYERWEERQGQAPGTRHRPARSGHGLPPVRHATAAAPAADPLPAASRRFLRERCDHYVRLPAELRAEFDRQVHAFLSEKRITGVEVPVTSEMRLLVAASAVTLTVGWPGFEWRRLSEVLLYPQDFDDDYRFDSGQMAGQAHQWGIVLLSVPSLRRSFEEPADGHHVGVHEFMHLLDVEGGEFDGIPAGFTLAHTADWDRIRKREERRIWRGQSVLDGYGLTNRVEFLAVTAEAFVETPVALRDRHRQLYDMLAAYFCQDPAAWEEARSRSPHPSQKA